MCLLEQTSVHCGDMPHNTSRNDLCCCWSHMKQITLFARERCQAVFTVFSKETHCSSLVPSKWLSIGKTSLEWTETQSKKWIPEYLRRIHPRKHNLLSLSLPLLWLVEAQSPLDVYLFRIWCLFMHNGITSSISHGCSTLYRCTPSSALLSLFTTHFYEHHSLHPNEALESTKWKAPIENTNHSSKTFHHLRNATT